LRPRRPKLLIGVVTITVLVGVAVLEVIDLWWQRDRALAEAESRANNLSYVLSEYVRDSFALADASLRQLVVHGTRVGGAGADQDAWDPILAAAKAALPGSGSLSVTNARGVIVHSTEKAIVGQSRTDGYIFKQLSTTADKDALVIDHPYLTTVEPRQYVIPVGRGMLNDNGEFGGMVVATIAPSAARAFFQTVDVGRRGVIWVLHPDGIVLYREPSAASHINESAVGNPILTEAIRTHGPGILTGPVEAGGPAFISGYRMIGTPPVVVAVSLDRDEVLAEWRAHRRSAIIAIGVLTLTVAVVLVALFRQMNARTLAEGELATAQRLEAERLREANDRLESALASEQRARQESEAASYLKDQFLMTVSHELRTPLTAIYGWVRMLATREIPREQQERAVAAIERNAAAQVRLIDDLLDVSRAISGKLRIELRPVNPADAVTAAADTVGPALEAKSIRFECSIDPQAGTVLADPDRLQQIVWNLLSNAIKFTPEQGTVRLRLARVDSQVEIVVSDTGAGVAPEFLPYVFERFRQADAGSRRKFGGLGLGLAIVRHLAELHGGTVSAESDGEGRGATFRVLLPLRTPAGDQPEDQPVANVLPAPARPSRLDGIRVLVVDDEADARELFASILHDAGASVLTAGSADAACSLIEREPIDVLLSDIEMPHEDGYQLLARARAKSRGDGAPQFVAIALTAYARLADRRRALDAGFAWHLAKPVEPSDLVSVVASLASPGPSVKPDIIGA
jgi:signal transduction histidine kinase/ActR/RegA family two-component response regulator